MEGTTIRSRLEVMQLRIESVGGLAINDYRIRDGRVEFR